MFLKKTKALGEILLVLIIIAVVCLIIKTNYVPGTWLSGWDNLHPEFNLKLNLWRSLNAVWQENFGLGVLGGMAHVVGFPRQMILFLSSFVIPDHLLRYFWTFLMLLMGSLGTCFFSRFLLVGRNIFKRNLFSLVAGLFYLLNLATLQYFYVPYETFVSFYGFLPWLLFFALKYLKKGSKKSLLFYFVVSFLATSAFYVQTMFVVYSICLVIFVLEAIIQSPLKGLVRSFKLALVTLAVNAFWFLPVAYFSFTSSSIPASSKINSIATPETQLMNQARGSLQDSVQLKGYWFDYYDYKIEEGKFDYLYSDWIEFSNRNEVLIFSKILFSLSLVGVIYAIFSKNKIGLAPALGIFVSLVMLGTKNPPFGFIYTFLSDRIPFFSEIFRNAFTKWSVVASFFYALGIGFFMAFISKIFKKKLFFIVVLIGILLSGIFIYSVSPVFQGKLISSSMRVKIPDEYFEMFSFLDNLDEEGRIAHFPMHSHWGWSFYEWGYNGSGFLWYGIKQPILDRVFDVWSPYNESFYSQASTALYSKNLSEFEKVLEKHQVKYLLLDESIINAGAGEKLLFIPEIQKLLSESEHIREIQNFGFLTVYETDFEVGDKFVLAPVSYTRINVDQKYARIDPIYSRLGTYINDENVVSYPFVNFDKRGELKIFEEGENIVFQNGEVKAFLPTEDKIVEDFTQDRGFKEAYNCDLKKKGQVWKENRGSSIWYKAEGGGVSCDFFDYSELKYNRGYVLRIKGNNLGGRSLKIYLFNKETTRMDLEELLPIGEFDEYFVVLPQKTEEGKNDKGYSLNLETRSFGRIFSENIIELIEFIPVDIDLLTNLVTFGEEPQKIQNNLQIRNVKKIGTSHYFVDTEGYGLLSLGQGYEGGWNTFVIPDGKYSEIKKWFPWFFFEPLEHTKLNSWANGWMVPQETEGKIAIIFWPQYLEWGGMILGGLTILSLIIIMVSEKCKNVYFTETNTGKRRTSEKGD